MKIIKDQTFKEGFHVDRSPVDIQNLENVVVQRVAYTIVPFQEYKKKSTLGRPRQLGQVRLFLVASHENKETTKRCCC